MLTTKHESTHDEPWKLIWNAFEMLSVQWFYVSDHYEMSTTHTSLPLAR